MEYTMSSHPGTTDSSRPSTAEAPLRKKHKKAAPLKAYSAGDQNPILFWNSHKTESTPPVASIRELHVYDFDNTLFRSPMPNPALFTDKAIGALTNNATMYDGGWWQYPTPLVELGRPEGVVDPDRDLYDWNDYWNEDLLPLVRMSHEDPSVLTIIMTGRRKKKFYKTLLNIIEQKGLEYDALILKQGVFDSTMTFKTQVLIDIFDFYKGIKLVKIFDDRPSQMRGFQKCLNEYIEAVRPEMIYSIIPVCLPPMHLEPKLELRVVNEAITKHNTWYDGFALKKQPVQPRLSLKRSVLFVSYFVEEETRAELIPTLLVNFPTIFTNEVMEHFRFDLEHIPLNRGMMTRKNFLELSKTHPTVSWRVTHIGFDDQLIALRLAPHVAITTLVDPPSLAVANRGTGTKVPEVFAAIEHWEPVEDIIEIKTTLSHIVRYNINGEPKVVPSK